MSMIEDIANKIANVYGYDVSTYALALNIVGTVEQANAAERNRLSEMLADRTDELIRLRRLVGEET